MMLTAIMPLAAPQGRAIGRAAKFARAGKLKTHPGTWVRMSDYPVNARREKREGIVEFLVHFGSDGIPTDILSSSGHDDLDNMTCRLVKARASFRPGRNARGEVVGGNYRNSVRWYLPK
jgi:outer membrane biosynthesis protein TonB